MADKLKMQSSDIIGENISFIESRFPNAIVEAYDENGKLTKKVDFEMLKQELSHVLVSDKQERYQMTWPDKKKSILLTNSPINGTLRPIKDESVDFENTKNIYIEGDNLDVLKLLRETYINKIKLIYIDPPYNTGEDFVYNDNFSEASQDYLNRSGQFDEQGNRLFTNTESNGRYHTDWLNMIYPRLRIAKDVLCDDGLIFISIADHEVANLKKICDEVFNEKNLVSILKWKKKKQPSFLSLVAGVMEYILVYAKDKSKIEQLSVEELTDSDKPIINGSNKEVERSFPSGIRVKCNQEFIAKGVYLNKSMNIEFLDDIYINNGRTSNSFRAIARFRNDQKTLDELISKDLVFITKNLGFRRDLDESEKGAGKAITDLLLDWGQNQDGSDELKKLFKIEGSDGVFSNPKPSLLIHNIIKTCTKENDIILDFFSGSATTADAMFQLNIKDNLNRSFILVQLPENLDENLKVAKPSEKNTIINAIKVCDSLKFPHEITKVAEERIRRAGAKIKAESGLMAESLDVGFRVLKLDSSNMKNVYYNPKEVVHSLLAEDIDNVKEDRTGLDLLFQVMLELGVELSAKIEEKQVGDSTIYVVNESYLVACFDKDINDEVVRTMANIKPVYIVLRDASFSNDSANINCEQTIKTISPSTELKVI